MIWRALFIAILVLLMDYVSAENSLTIYAEPDPPMIERPENNRRGPMIDALIALTKPYGENIHVQLLPMERGLLLIRTQPDSCVLGADYQASDAEVLKFVAPVTPIFVTVWRRKGDNRPMSSFESLSGLHLGVVRRPQLQSVLESHKLSFLVIPNPVKAPEMLAAQRFDALISDSLVANKEYWVKEKLVAAQTLAVTDEWLVCNGSIKPERIKHLRAALVDGLFSAVAEPVWRSYGLIDYFQRARREWLDAGTSK